MEPMARSETKKYNTNFTNETAYGRGHEIFAFDSSKAKIVIRPEPGDFLRIVYILEGGGRKALISHERVQTGLQKEVRKAACRTQNFKS
jgi:hypothetical protein